MILSCYRKKIAGILTGILLFVACLPVSGFCEIIIMKDGSRIEDTIIKSDYEKLILLKSGNILKDRVKEIMFHSEEVKAEEKTETTDKEILSIMKEAEEFEQKYSDYNGLVLLDDGLYEYNEDGTSRYRYHYRYKVLRDVKKNEANITFYFNEGRERINILLARTISADGKVSDLDRDTITIADPMSRSTTFSRFKTFSFMLPNVEIGSIIEYIMELNEYNPFEKKFFFPNFGFQGDDPALLSRLTVTVPEAETLYYVFRNFKEEYKKPKIFESGNKKSYVWEFENVAPVVSEPYMPAYKDVIPFISCSLFNYWDIFFNWSKGFLEKNINVTPEIEKKVRELTEGCSNDEERIAEIYHYIQRHIRYISIKSSIGSGYSGHPAQETLQSEYGDCIDKAILFTTMLKVLGIESYPVLLKTNNSNDMEMRLPGFDSNHAITKIVLNGKDMYLDSTAENFRYPYFQSVDHGIWVLNPIQGKFDFIPTPPPEANAKVSVEFCRINGDGDFELDGSSSFTGDSEAMERYYIKHIKGSDQKRYIADGLSSLSPGSVLKYFTYINGEEFSRPLYFDIGYILKNYCITAGDLVILSIPDIERSFGEAALEERKYPLEFSTSFQEKREVVIDLAGKFTVKYLPEPLNISTKYFSYKMEYREENGKVIFSEDYKRKERVVPVSDYSIYRKAHKEIERRGKDRIFLTRMK